MAVAVDAAGNAYFAGDTVSTNFPLVNAFQSTNHNQSNGWVVYVSKMNPAGTALVYSTFLGGIADSHALGIAVDSTGSAYVGGYTGAGDYPVTPGSFQQFCGANFTTATGPEIRTNGCSPSGDTGGFLTKLSPAGNSLVYSTFLSGNAFTEITGVAVDAAGEAYVAGNTNSGCGPGPYYPAPFGENSIDCFPTTSGALQAEINGAYSPGGQIWGFLTKFSADGSTLLYSTLFASPSSLAPIGDTIGGLALDSSGDAYITGVGGYGLPTSTNAYYVPPAYSSTALPPVAAFVAKFDPTQSGSVSLVYSTYLGSAVQTANASNYNNTGTGVAVDANGDAIVVGYTNVCGYPTTLGAYQTGYNSAPYCQDGFVSMVNPTGTGLVWSTILGSTTPANISNTQLAGVALGSNGNVYVTGTVGGGTFPVMNPINPAVNGGAVLAELNSTGSSLVFSTYLSGYYGSDYSTGVAVDLNGNMYWTGRVDSNTPTIPTTAGALQTTYQGGPYDAFAVKIAPFAVSTSALSVSGSPVSYGTSVTLAATVTGPNGLPIPTGTVSFMNGSTALGTGTLDGSGVATFTSSTLSATTYSITANYAGDAEYYPSVSAIQVLVVNPVATTTALSVTPATASLGTSVTLSAHVTPNTGSIVPTGSITFLNGTQQIAVATLDGTGTGSFTSTTLAVGSYSITAAYSGDNINASSTSAAAGLVISSSGPAAPVLSPAPGFYKLPQLITITDSTPGAVIYYVLNQNAPVKYTAPFPLTGSDTIQAVAIVPSHGTYTEGPVTLGAYNTANPPPAAPVLIPAGGSFTGPQSIQITEVTAGVTVYYSINGGTAQKYLGPINLAANATIEAVAIGTFGTSYSESALATGSFTIH